jgi:hypothetical protein
MGQSRALREDAGCEADFTSLYRKRSGAYNFRASATFLD